MKQPTKMIPELRFKGFEGEWEEKELGKIAIKTNEKNINNDITTVFSNSAIRGIILQEDYFDREITNDKNINTYSIVRKNDFVYNPRISKHAPVGPINKNNTGLIGIVSPLYTVFRIRNNKIDHSFLNKYFITSKWYKYMNKVANFGARHDRMNITLSDLFNMPLFVPTLPEQAKIANFLSSVDTKIEQATQQIELLKEYKKGLMQQLFPQKGKTNPRLRFKDDAGKEFPDWEKKKLKDVLVKNSEKNKKLEYDLVQSVSNKYGFINQDEYFEDRVVASKNLSNYYVIRKGMFAYNPSRIDVGSLAYQKQDVISVISPLYISFSAKKICLIDRFLLNWFSSREFVKQMNSSFEGSVRNTLSYSALSLIKVSLPTFPEQIKIANFLSTLDNKIEQIEEQLGQMQVWKKGLLQKMFV